MGFCIEIFNFQIFLNYFQHMDFLLTIFLYHSFPRIFIFLIIVQLKFHLESLLSLQLPVSPNNGLHFLSDFIRNHLVIMPYFLQMVLNFQPHIVELHKGISFSLLKKKGLVIYLQSNSTITVFHLCRVTYLKRICFILCC